YKVIYNGINLNRFSKLQPAEKTKIKFGIKTKFTIVMVANITKNKDYEMFISVAKYVSSIRNDITFLCIGDIKNSDLFNKMKLLAMNCDNILFTGRVDDVENLINICEIGILFSNKKYHGEGVSNAILEYMALNKPVIANDAGGT